MTGGRYAISGGTNGFPSFALWLLALVQIVATGRSYGQTSGMSKELPFAQWLRDHDEIPEALYVLEKVDTSVLGQAEKDSLFYTLGWTAYMGKQLDKAILWLGKVSPGSSQFYKSRLFAAWCQAYLGRRDTAGAVLRQLSLRDTLELVNLQLAGIALLDRDYEGYRALSRHFTYSSYLFSKEEERMQQYYNNMRGFRRKSPLLAGIYSGLVPGLGKWYAGKKAQGIAAFLPVTALALLTYEGYHKDGPGSARFIGFGSLFAILYIGNIWGSTLSVRIRRNEFYKEYDNKILFDMHIPLRNFFN